MVVCLNAPFPINRELDLSAISRKQQQILHIMVFFSSSCTSRETKACFLVPVERRDKDSPLRTRVMSDMWKAYDCLQDEGYVHLTVNHRLNFVDPDTGAHTQRIESTWWGVKRSLPHTGGSKELFEGYVHEWLWRQHYGQDPFGNTVEHTSQFLNRSLYHSMPRPDCFQRKNKQDWRSELLSEFFPFPKLCWLQFLRGGTKRCVAKKQVRNNLLPSIYGVT